MNEIWRPYQKIDFIEGSNLGRVRTIGRYVKTKNGKRWIKGQVLKQHDNGCGYLKVNFRANGKQVNLQVHRIIASCFLPNPDHLPQVNHKNCVRDDNRVENLEWCSREYNNDYRDKFGYGVNCGLGRMPIIAINLKTLEPLQFPSQMEAARQLVASPGAINEVIKGKLNKHHYYWFTNADENAAENTRVNFGNSVAEKVAKLMEVQ